MIGAGLDIIVIVDVGVVPVDGEVNSDIMDDDAGESDDADAMMECEWSTDDFEEEASHRSVLLNGFVSVGVAVDACLGLVGDGGDASLDGEVDGPLAAEDDDEDCTAVLADAAALLIAATAAFTRAAVGWI